jgi:hypothetical protein
MTQHDGGGARRRALETVTYGLFHAGDVWAREDLDPRFVGRWHLSHSTAMTATALDAARDALSSNMVLMDIHPNLARTNDEIRQYLRLFVECVGDRHRAGVAMRDVALRMATERLRSYDGSVWALDRLSSRQVEYWHAHHPPEMTVKVVAVVREALAKPACLMGLRLHPRRSVDEIRRYLGVFLRSVDVEEDGQETHHG